uniref:Uncharacterized protein n=1 Tax=Trichogramma kaykai TaxID=54128 RepID=A0ABD2XD45_9HYME
MNAKKKQQVMRRNRDSSRECRWRRRAYNIQTCVCIPNVGLQAEEKRKSRTMRPYTGLSAAVLHACV